MKKKSIKKKFLKVLAGFMVVLIAFIGITTVVSVIGLKANIKKANSFSAVETEELKEINKKEYNITDIGGNRDRRAEEEARERDLSGATSKYAEEILSVFTNQFI